MTSPSETLFDDLQCLRELAEECYQTRVQAHGAPREQFTKTLLERGKAAFSALQRQREQPDFNQEVNLHADTIAERFDAQNEQPVGKVAERIAKIRLCSGEQSLENLKWLCDTAESLAAQVAEANRRAENSKLTLKSICDEWNEDCEPECDSVAHELDCAATQIIQAMKKRRERAEAAEKALAIERAMLRLLENDLSTRLTKCQAELSDSEEKRAAAEKDAKLLRGFYEAWNICDNTRGKYSCVAEHDSRCANQFMKTGKCVCGAAELARAEAAIDAASKGEKP